LVLGVVAGLFALALHQGLPEADARALAFVALVTSNLGLVLVNRSQRASLIAAFHRRNVALWWVTGATGVILAVALAVPAARELFHFGALHPGDIAVALACGVAVLLLLDAAKRRPNRGPRTPDA
jgi:Ca2+-transporting ATPase